MSKQLVGVLPGPICSNRSNNPHPRPDFLEPKNLKEKDAQVALQHKVQRAVHDYVLKSLGEGNLNNIKRIMEHRDYPQLTQSMPTTLPKTLPGVSVHSYQKKDESLNTFIKSSLQMLDSSLDTDHRELKRERGNHYKAAAKTYGSVPAESTTGDRKTLINIDMDKLTTVMNTKTKRTHTPPTPPAQARRPKSAAYEAQVAAAVNGRGQSPRPVLYRAKTAPLREEMFEEGEEDDVESEIRRAISSARPEAEKGRVTPNLLAPRMKAWVEGANDYEKEVAYNMLQTVSGVKTGNRTPVTRPKTGSLTAAALQRGRGQGRRAPSATHVYAPPSPAPRQAIPSRNGRDDAQVQEWMKKLCEKLELQEPPVNVQQYLKSVSLPKAPRKKRVSLREDYTHENSHFMMTQPTYRRHFVIAPDWVSERTSHRRLQQQGWNRKNRFAKGVGC